MDTPWTGLTPRKYQEEIFTQSLESNVIAALGTGGGKTLISALLIKSTALKNVSRSKVIIFLVPKVALVEQQAAFLSSNTPLKVAKLHGQTVDVTDHSSWESRFKEHDVFVMTAQIFLNLLTHSIWSIERTSLIVFDECHSARKKHPYNQIMNGFYFHAPVALRPKIFGMTASPVWDPGDPMSCLTTLERNLDAKVVDVRQHSAELELHLPRPSEIIEVYAPPATEEHDSHLHRALGAFASFFSKNDDDFDWAKTERRYNAALYDLGVYCAELYLFREVDSRVSVLVAQAMPLLPDASGVDEEIITVPGFASRFKAPSPELAHVADILDDHRDFFLEDTSQHIALDRCTPKVGKLISILMDYEASTRTLRTPSSGSAMPNLAPFQTIIFVEQRHTASCLAHLLPRIAELGGKFESGVLLGEGAGPEGAPPTANAISGGGRADTLNMFRKGEINVLVATSVAEEGLDFPACSLVIRFDPLQNLVAYVQSRGRARSKTASKFIIMLREDDNVELERYRQFLRGEPELQKQLSARLSHPAQADEEDDESDALYEMNLKDRERYVVPGTGATLNYDNAINLLGQLCALIPCDAFTQKQAPKFDVSVSPFPSHAVASVISSELPCVGYSCMLRLPGSLPLPSTHLSYTGPVKLTKKEAKRAVAFQAVKALQEFNVFNEFLLPTTVGSKSKALKGKKDVDGRGYVDVSMVLPMMNVNVRDPWFNGPNTQNLGLASGATDSSLWLHAIYINDQRVAGVVADISLPPCEFWTDQGSLVKMMSGRKLNLRQFSSHDIADILMGCMAQYTLKGIWYFLTGSPAAGSPSFYIVPLVHDAIEPDIDFTALRSFAAHPDGRNDWSDVTLDHYDRVLVMNRNQYGRVYLLRRIRHDLSPQSMPVDGSRESGPATYYEFWKDSWTRKKWIADVPEDGPLIEATRLTRRLHAQYDVYRRAEYHPRHEVRDGALLPQGACVWIEFPPDVAQAFEIAPALAHRISDVYRVTSARLDIGLPAISPDLLVEAFTIPSANAPYNNQRLETLGDSVLKVCVTVHAFTKYPHRHEGQLTRLRQWTISNACLLARAKEVGLESYLICENVSATRWPHFQWEGEGDDLPFKRFAKVLPRRSLQDCMEATLGAAFLTGGIPMVLHTGDALGLAFGGSIPWSLRYGTNPSPQSKLNLCYFESLQNSLGYSFRRPDLLVEALTHPSYSNESGGRSYQRLEFLGDAILDLVVVHFLYRKFPQATSHQLSFPRTRAICSQALAWVGIRKLQIHKFMLVNNFGLTSTVLENVSIFEECSAEEIVKRGWRYDPPKVISDIVESLLGGILVDSGWNYEMISVITEVLMADVLEVLSPALELYPTSDLTEWVATSGCEKLSWRKLETPNVSRVAVLIHDRVVAGPITSPSLALAKHAAAERALAFLRDPNSDKSLEKLCSCKTKRRHTPRVSSASCADQDDPEEEAERKEVETLLLSGI